MSQLNRQLAKTPKKRRRNVQKAAAPEPWDDEKTDYLKKRQRDPESVPAGSTIRPGAKRFPRMITTSAVRKIKRES